MKIAIISQHSVDSSYEIMSNLQYEYCLKNFINLNIPTFRFVGYDNVKENKNNHNDDSFFYEKEKDLIHLNCPDLDIASIDPKGYKTYYMFKYLLDNVDFDILFRTSCTVYLDAKRIIKFAENLPTKGTYTGAISSAGRLPFWFVISAFCFMSRDMIQTIVDNKELYLNFAVGHYLDAEKRGETLVGVDRVEAYEDVCVSRVYNSLNISYENQVWAAGPVYWKGGVKMDDIEIHSEAGAYRFDSDNVEGFKKLHNLYLNQDSKK